MRFHAFHCRDGNLEFPGDNLPFVVRHQADQIAGDFGAEFAQVEEQAFLRRRRADPDDGGVSDDIFLYSRKNPP